MFVLLPYNHYKFSLNTIVHSIPRKREGGRSYRFFPFDFLYEENINLVCYAQKISLTWIKIPDFSMISPEFLGTPKNGNFSHYYVLLVNLIKNWSQSELITVDKDITKNHFSTLSSWKLNALFFARDIPDEKIVLITCSLHSFQIGEWWNCPVYFPYTNGNI